MNKFNNLRASWGIVFAILAILILSIPDCSGGSQETIHAKKCDKYCGGSRLNPFGSEGTCHYCCLEKGFVRGGECGDFLYRHCRCPINPPVQMPGYPGIAAYTPTHPPPHNPLPQPYPPMGFTG